MWVWMESALVEVCHRHYHYVSVKEVCSGVYHGYCYHIGVNGVCYGYYLAYGYEWGLLRWRSAMGTATMWVWIGSALVRLWHRHYHHMGMNGVCFDEGLPLTLSLCGYGLLWWGSWTLPPCGCEWGLPWWGSVYHHVSVNGVCFDKCLPTTM